MRLAERNYRLAGLEHEAARCQAIRFELLREFRKAGLAYASLALHTEAVRCLWKAEAYDELAANPAFDGTIERAAAAFLRSERGAGECEAFASTFFARLEGPDRPRIVADSLWRSVIGRFVEALAALPQSAIDWGVQYRRLANAVHLGFEVPHSPSLAELAYRAGSFAEAVAIWETHNVSLQTTRNYVAAKTNAEPYPQRIPWIALQKDTARIVAEYEAHPETPLPRDVVAAVVGAHLEQGRVETALSLIRRYKGSAPLEAAFEILARDARYPEALEEVAASLTSEYSRSGRWKDAIRVVQRAGALNDAGRVALAMLAFEVASADVAAIDPTSNLSKFLRGCFLESSVDGSIPVRIAGAAIEKAGVIVDALAFYEQYLRPGYPDTEFARQRWLRCKLRHAELQRRVGKVGDAERIQRQVNEFAAANRLSAEAIPDYPQILPADRPQPRATAAVPVDDEKRQAALLLHQTGWSAERIATVVGLPPDVVAGLLGPASPSE